MQLVQNLSLPRFEMDPFDGFPGDFCRFVTAFNTHAAGQISDMSRHLSYLLNYCRGPAQSAIEHCALLPPNERYTEALSILKDRFGKPHDVIQAVTKPLLEGP